MRTRPTLRPALEADAAAIAALHAASFATSWSAAEVTAMLGSAGLVAIVAEDADREDADRVVGFLLGRHAADEGEVLSIAVERNRRRAGTGSALLERFVAGGAAAGIARLFIEVAEADGGAVAFYARAGFAICGRRPAYYPDRPAGANDALLMRLDIAAAESRRTGPDIASRL